MGKREKRHYPGCWSIWEESYRKFTFHWYLSSMELADDGMCSDDIYSDLSSLSIRMSPSASWIDFEGENRKRIKSASCALDETVRYIPFTTRVGCSPWRTKSQKSDSNNNRRVKASIIDYDDDVERDSRALFLSVSQPMFLFVALLQYKRKTRIRAEEKIEKRSKRGRGREKAESERQRVV